MRPITGEGTFIEPLNFMGRRVQSEIQIEPRRIAW